MTHIKDFFARMSDSGKRKKKLFLALFASVLLIAAVLGILAGVNSGKTNSDTIKASTSHTIIKSSCSSTFYPDLCFSAIASVPEMSKKVISQKDVIMMSLNLTVAAVEHNYFAVEKLLKNKKKSLTAREETALHDCLETIDETLDELHKAEDDLVKYPTKKTLTQHADDLKTLMSAAITNQETCLDGFSHDDADERVRETLLEGQEHVEKMCSNALAMIKNMTDTDIANEMKLKGRKLGMEEDYRSRWPEWLSAGDRRLLQSSTVTPDVVVAADGSGDHRTVSAAVAAAPQKSTRRYIIRVKAGVYRENVEIPKKKTNIMLMGDGRKNTIITASRNVQDGSTTFHSATVGEPNHSN